MRPKDRRPLLHLLEQHRRRCQGPFRAESVDSCLFLESTWSRCALGHSLNNQSGNLQLH